MSNTCLWLRARQHLIRVQPCPPISWEKRKVRERSAHLIAHCTLWTPGTVTSRVEVGTSVTRTRVGTGVGGEAFAKLVGTVGAVVFAGGGILCGITHFALYEPLE